MSRRPKNKSAPEVPRWSPTSTEQLDALKEHVARLRVLLPPAKEAIAALERARSGTREEFMAAFKMWAEARDCLLDELQRSGQLERQLARGTSRVGAFKGRR